MSENAVANSRVSGSARLLRGWTVAVIAVVIAAGGHQVAHSFMRGMAETIPLQLLVFSAALTAPVAVALAGRRLSSWSTAITTIVAQIAFHLLYSLPYSGAQITHGAHGHHGHQQLSVQLSPETHTAHAMHSTPADDVAMLAAHLLAAALTTLMIVHGEHSLVAIASWLTLAPTRFVLATLPLSLARPKAVQPMTRVWIPQPMNVCQTRSTRGPPRLA